MTELSVEVDEPAGTPWRARVSRGLARRFRSPSWLARAAGVGLCLVSLGFVLLFVLVLGTYGPTAVIIEPPLLRVTLALPFLVAVFVVGTVVGAGLAWMRGYWSLAARVHQTILALLGVGFLWKLVALGFLL